MPVQSGTQLSRKKTHQITGAGTETSGTISMERRLSKGRSPGCVTNMVKALQWESLQDRRKRDYACSIKYRKTYRH